MAKTVLIVEDDRNIADLLRLYLEKEGYTVVIAPDGMRGVEQFRTVHPSLVLLDVMLPGLDGWGVCRAIRAESQTPIIMLTAKSETEDKVNGLKQGADDYITKPFEMKEVLARIEAVLRRSGIEPEKSTLPRRRTASIRAISCSTRSGALTTSAIRARSTCTSSACARSSRAFRISGT